VGGRLLGKPIGLTCRLSGERMPEAGAGMVGSEEPAASMDGLPLVAGVVVAAEANERFGAGAGGCCARGANGSASGDSIDSVFAETRSTAGFVAWADDSCVPVAGDDEFVWGVEGIIAGEVVLAGGAGAGAGGVVGAGGAMALEIVQ
jgi:hypothetical protein